MASETDICNLAISRLGEQAHMIDLSENSTYAAVAKETYPIVLNALLERHAWNFATTRARGQLVDETPIGWKYMYQVPSKCLRMVAVYAEASGETIEQEPWVVEMHGDYRVVLTNIENAVIKYIAYVTNIDLFSPGFVEALTWHLAAALAGPIVKGETGMTVNLKLLQNAQYFEAAAIQADSRQRRTLKYEPVDFIDRGVKGTSLRPNNTMGWPEWVELRGSVD